MRHLIPALMLCVLSACVVACVGPERSISGGSYTDSDTPHNVAQWTAGDDLTLSTQGDPTAYVVNKDGAAIATEGIGTGLGISPEGAIYLWSPKDVEIGAMSFSVDESGRLIPTSIENLVSRATDARLARNELAKTTASQIVQLAEIERAAVVASVETLAAAGSEFAADVLAALVTGGAR